MEKGSGAFCTVQKYRLYKSHLTPSFCMRELLIEHRRTEDLKKYFKIANLILAAPDLDYGVVRQRLLAEQFGTAFGQITVYTTSGDKRIR